jgi:MFS transporter, FHS family, L-fucose permease
MNEKKIKLQWIVPVLLSFFVMSFCDLVGTGVDHVKTDFHLSNTLAQLIPSAVFLWFLLLSVPFGILQDRIGKRKVLNLGMIITTLGLLIPFIYYSFPTALVAFAFLGIGNTIVQVSANPLLVDVVPDSKRSSFLSFSQFVKAIGSMVAAPLAGWVASRFGDWRIVFIVFGVVSILAILWLSMTPIEETKNNETRATFSSSFSLLGNRFITMMVAGIFLVVGIDVGMNSSIGQLLLEKFHCPQSTADYGHSVYFLGKMIGTFCGAFILALVSSRKLFIWSSIAGIVSIVALMLVPSANSALVVSFIIGLGFSNIWPLIFSLTVEKYPQRSNEVSGLMIMAIFGGAVVPIIIGRLSDKINVTAGIGVLLLCAAYLVLLSFMSAKKREEA